MSFTAARGTVTATLDGATLLADGSLTRVSVSTAGTTLPTTVRAFLMVDTCPAATATITP